MLIFCNPAIPKKNKKKAEKINNKAEISIIISAFNEKLINLNMYILFYIIKFGYLKAFKLLVFNDSIKL